MKNRIYLLLATLFISTMMVAQPSSNQITATDFYERGIELHKSADFNTAIDYYTEAILMDKNHVNAYYNRGMLYFETEKYNKALNDYNRVILIGPEAADAYEQRARVHYMLGNFRESVNDFNKAMANNINGVLLLNRAKAKIMTEDLDGALTDLQGAISYDEQNSEIFVNIGDIYFKMEQYFEAHLEYDKAIALEPDNYLAYNNRAGALMKIGIQDKALEDYNTALGIHSNSYVFVNRAFYWLHQGNYENAVDDCKRATQLDPRNANAYYVLGLADLNLKMYEEAALNFNKALELDVDNTQIHNNRGLAYYNMGQFEEAILDFNTALELDAQNEVAEVRLQECLELINQMEPQNQIAKETPLLEEEDAVVEYNVGKENSKIKEIIPEVLPEIIPEIESYEIDEDGIVNQDMEIKPEEFNDFGDDMNYEKFEEDGAFIAKGVNLQEIYNQKNKTVINKPTGNYHRARKQSANEMKFEERNIIQEQIDNAIYYNKANHYQQALDIFNQLAMQGESSYQLHNQRGLTHYKLQNFEEAIMDFTEAISLDKNAAEAFYNRGHVFYDINNVSGAFDDFEKAIFLDPKFEKAFFMRGQCYASFKNDEAALQDFNTCLKLNPEHLNSLNNRATIKLLNGNVYGAIEDYNRAIELTPQSSVLYENRAKAFEFAKEYLSAIKDMNMAIELNPYYMDLYYQRGILKYKEKNYRGALIDFNRAIKDAKVKKYEFIYQRALAFHKLDKDRKAIEDYDTVIKIRPDYKEAYFNRATAKKAIGEDVGACADYAKARSLGLKKASIPAIINYCEGK